MIGGCDEIWSDVNTRIDTRHLHSHHTEVTPQLKRRRSLDNIASNLSVCPGTWDNLNESFTLVLLQVLPALFSANEGSGSAASLTMEAMIADCGYAHNGTRTWPNCVGVYHYDDRTCK